MSRGAAAFDFDKTIARRDTLVPFLFKWDPVRFIPVALVSVLRALIGRGPTRDLVKREMVARLFGGVSAAELDARGATYARELPRLYRPEMLERIAWHRAQGHRLVLVTASLGAYARRAGTELGFDDVIATEIEANGDGVLTGRLDGLNVRGPEKARRLRQLFGERVPELWAYGDSAGDRDMLAMADHACWLGRRRAKTASASEGDRRE